MGHEVTWEEWMHHCEVWFDPCDALLYLSSSRGADIEAGWAWDKGIPVYHSVDEVPPAPRRRV